jgi:hypothetical protein
MGAGSDLELEDDIPADDRYAVYRGGSSSGGGGTGKRRHAGGSGVVAELRALKCLVSTQTLMLFVFAVGTVVACMFLKQKSDDLDALEAELWRQLAEWEDTGFYEETRATVQDLRTVIRPAAVEASVLARELAEQLHRERLVETSSDMMDQVRDLIPAIHETIGFLHHFLNRTAFHLSLDV